MARKYKDEEEKAREIALRVVQMIAEIDKSEAAKKAGTEADKTVSSITPPDATRIIEAGHSPEWVRNNRSQLDDWKQHQDKQFQARYGITDQQPANVVGRFDPAKPTVVYFLGADIPGKDGTMPVTLAADKIKALIEANPSAAKQNVVFVSMNGLDMAGARDRALAELTRLHGGNREAAIEAAKRNGLDAVFIQHGSPGKDGQPGTYLRSVGGPDGMKNGSITELRAFGVDDPHGMWRNIQLANCFGSDVFKAEGMLRSGQLLYATPRGAETSAFEFAGSIEATFKRTGGSLAVADVAPDRFASTLKGIADVRKHIEEQKAAARSQGRTLTDDHFARNSELAIVRLVASNREAEILPRQVMAGDRTIDLVRDVIETRPTLSADAINQVGGVFSAKKTEVAAIAARIAAGTFNYDAAKLEDKAIALSLAQHHHIAEQERQRQAAAALKTERATAAVVVADKPELAAAAVNAGEPAKQEMAEVKGGVVRPEQHVVAQQREQGAQRGAIA